MLNPEGARRVIAAAAAEAKRLNATGGVIAVASDGGNLVALERPRPARHRQDRLLPGAGHPSVGYFPHTDCFLVALQPRRVFSGLTPMDCSGR
jgi:hypothetical protein